MTKVSGKMETKAPREEQCREQSPQGGEIGWSQNTNFRWEGECPFLETEGWSEAK